MASFSTVTTTSSSNASSNIASRELNLIASSFVKQYYTLLNKAPCFIHNFYSQYSTFIHGAIEMANEHFTEPIVGREKIQSKMEEMKLNDCRAKIKQIDCLETLAGGLVIQVIGELSNNGKPMRRFLQTFVLAPSPDETRQDGKDSVHQRGSGANDSRRGVHLNENNASSSSNQKFFVLNSIFRYQDDGPDSESEDDVVGVQANISIDGSNNAGDHVKEARKPIQGTPNPSGVGSVAPQQPATPIVTAHAKAQQLPINNETESRRTGELGVGGGAGAGSGVRIVPNGMGSNDKKSETSEKSTSENGKSTLDQSQKSMNSTASAQGIQPPAATTPSAATSQSKPITTAMATATTTTTTTTPTTTLTTAAAPAPRPQPTSEPKTWANMVSRNAHPPSATVQSNASGTKSLHPDQQNQSQPSHHQQSQQHSHHQHQTQSQSDQQPNAQNNSNNNNINNSNTNTTTNNNNNNNNNNSNNRRRHMLRKPSNKSNGGGGASGGGGGGSGGGAGGSRLKNRDRPRPPAAGK